MRQLGIMGLLVLMGSFPAARAQEARLVLPETPLFPSPPPLSRDSGAAVPRPGADGEFLRIEMGYRTWVSFGQSTISMSGSGGFPNIISELKWQRLVNPIQELNVESFWGEKFIVRMDFGIGTGGSGRFGDQDYNDNDRTSLASDTSHPANDNRIGYFNLDVGYRIWDLKSPASRFTGDLLLGYQFWQEKYIASGGEEVFPNPGPFPPGHVVANTFRWDSFRMGGRVDVESGCWKWGTKLMFVPVNHFRDDDIHYLRGDLLQDPSFIDEATGGFGVMLDATISYRIWEHVTLEAGYRVWYNRAGIGLDLARTIQGDLVSPLHQVQTVRQGLLLGLQCRF